MCKDRFNVLEDWLAEVFSPLCAVEGALFMICGTVWLAVLQAQPGSSALPRY